MAIGDSSTLPKLSFAEQKKIMMDKLRADALRTNLKKRKDQNNARKDETKDQ